MLRAMLTGLGLAEPISSSVIYSPFSKSAFRMRKKPIARPLQMSTFYSTKAALAKNQFGLFGENNVDTVKRWLSHYYKEMKVNTARLTVTKMPLQVGDRFVGFNRDKLLNKHVIMYPQDILGHNIWKKIFNRAKKQNKELGVLELIDAKACFKVSLAKDFWFVLVPHRQLTPLHKVRRLQDLEQNSNTIGITRKNK